MLSIAINNSIANNASDAIDRRELIVAPPSESIGEVGRQLAASVVEAAATKRTGKTDRLSGSLRRKSAHLLRRRYKKRCCHFDLSTLCFYTTQSCELIATNRLACSIRNQWRIRLEPIHAPIGKTTRTCAMRTTRFFLYGPTDRSIGSTGRTHSN